MTGKIQCITTHIAAVVDGAISGALFNHLWCGAHQLDLVVKRAQVQGYIHENFYKTLSVLIG